MPHAPTAKRYAQAAFQIAQERDEIDQWADELQASLAVVEDATLRTYLKLPKVRIADKLKAIQETLGNINPLVRNLVGLLASRNAIELYPRVVAEYQRFVDGHRNRERAVVMTAVPLDSQQEERLRQQLSKLLDKEVILSTQVEPQILGGLVARVGDRMVDGSTRGRLLDLRKSLMAPVG